MTQPFLGAGERGSVVASLEINDAVRRQPRLGQRRREQIGLGETPQDHAAGSGGDPGDEQHRRRVVFSAGGLMQRAEG